jgi:hypothetical protein
MGANGSSQWWLKIEKAHVVACARFLFSAFLHLLVMPFRLKQSLVNSKWVATTLPEYHRNEMVLSGIV